MPLILTLRKKVKPVFHQFFYLEYILTKQKKMYKCKHSSVKLHYACKAHNDIPGTHKNFLSFLSPTRSGFLFKDELSALCHSSNYVKYRVLLDRVIITDKASLVRP